MATFLVLPLSNPMGILSSLRKLRLFVYFTLTFPTNHHRIRAFRFGIPLVMKTENRLFSTEADALRFLNASGIDFPIPRLLDSIAIDGKTYTIMSRIPGSLLRDEMDQISEPDLRAIVNDVRTILDRLWGLKQSPSDAGKVMLSASGHGLPDPVTFFDTYWGPSPSVLECYFSMSANLSIESDNEWTEVEFVATYGDAVRAVTADRVVSTMICGCRTSLSTTGGLVGSLIGVVAVPLAASHAAEHAGGI